MDGWSYHSVYYVGKFNSDIFYIVTLWYLIETIIFQNFQFLINFRCNKYIFNLLIKHPFNIYWVPAIVKHIVTKSKNIPICLL